MNGIVFYDGPSQISGVPIVGIETLVTKNRKTGPMIQTWILCKNIHPYTAVKWKEDYSVCGDCPLKDNGCYVRVNDAPNSIWKAYKKGMYAVYDRASILRASINRTVRLGSYGDPAALPLWTIQDLLHFSVGHTGYTHQWRWASHLKPYCMASVESMEDYYKAKELGWRTFRIRPEGEERIKNVEIQCPAADGLLTCNACLACSGNHKSLTGDVSIEVHGHTKRKVFDA